MVLSPRRWSAWALPPEEQRTALRSTIDAVAAATRTEGFDPHVTLASTDATHGAREVQVDRLGTALEGVAPLVLASRGVTATDAWFRALVLRVEASEPLVALRRRVADALGAEDAPYWPHLSLWYGDLDAAAKAPLFALVEPQVPSIVAISSVALVDVTDDDHTAWAVLAGWPLTGH